MLTVHTDHFATSAQIACADLQVFADQGYRTIVNNRPDGEGGEQQPLSSELEAEAKRLGLNYVYLPFTMATLSQGDAQVLVALLRTSQIHPILAFCRSGHRSSVLYQRACALLEESALPQYCGEEASGQLSPVRISSYDVVILGAGTVGLSIAAALRRKLAKEKIAVVDERHSHPCFFSWPWVSAGLIDLNQTMRPMQGCIPPQVDWVQSPIIAIDADERRVFFKDGTVLAYEYLVVCSELEPDWGAITGLEETLGRNGVSSNCRLDLTTYTRRMVQILGAGEALFVQPDTGLNHIAGGYEALCLACDDWLRSGYQGFISTTCFNAGENSIFSDAVLNAYFSRYQVESYDSTRLVAVDGAAHQAHFVATLPDGREVDFVRRFDFLHVVPPHQLPEFLRHSELLDGAGRVQVDADTLQQGRYANVFVAGVSSSASCLGTLAEGQLQAAVVIKNLLMRMQGKVPQSTYTGCGVFSLAAEQGRLLKIEIDKTYSEGVCNLNLKKLQILGQGSWWIRKHLFSFFYWNVILKGWANPFFQYYRRRSN